MSIVTPMDVVHPIKLEVWELVTPPWPLSPPVHSDLTSHHVYSRPTSLTRLIVIQWPVVWVHHCQKYYTDKSVVFYPVRGQGPTRSRVRENSTHSTYCWERPPSPEWHSSTEVLPHLGPTVDSPVRIQGEYYTRPRTVVNDLTPPNDSLNRRSPCTESPRTLHTKPSRTETSFGGTMWHDGQEIDIRCTRDVATTEKTWWPGRITDRDTHAHLPYSHPRSLHLQAPDKLRTTLRYTTHYPRVLQQYPESPTLIRTHLRQRPRHESRVRRGIRSDSGTSRLP